MAAWEAACAAAWLHGRAATLLGRGMLAEDIPSMLARAVAELSS
jgi:NAD(P)H-hydrate repair Nnr-like enzyme with NAD(P)H-hydrate dehydratase domain